MKNKPGLYKVVLKQIIVFLFLYLTVNPSRIYSQVVLKPISQKILSNDFSLIRIALQEAHPGIYRYTPKSEMDKLFDSIQFQLSKPMTTEEFYKLTEPIITRIKCGHTKYLPPKYTVYNYYYNTDKLIPLKLYFTDSTAFILKSFEKKSLLKKGSQIQSINGKKINDIKQLLMMYIPSDGNVLSAKYSELNDFFNAYYANFIGASDTFQLELVTPLGKYQKVTIPSVKLSEIPKNEVTAPEPKTPYSFEIKDSIGILTISSFWFESNEIKFEKFLKKTFQTIKKEQIQSLIIDVRNNEGGYDERGALLLSYLMDKPFNYYKKITVATNKKYSFEDYASLPPFMCIMRLKVKEQDGEYVWPGHSNLKVQKPQKEAFNGKVIVLINGRSYSVTAEFASVAKTLNRAIFVGDETGGAYEGNNSGTFTIVELPGTNLSLGIPMAAYHLEVPSNIQGSSGVIPDYIIKPSINDLLNAKDPVMQRAMELAKKQ